MVEKEKRSFDRIDNQFNVRIAKEISQDLFKDILLNAAKSVNISATGILLYCKEILAIDQPVRVTFLQPNTFEFFEGKGTVVRIDPKSADGYLIAINFSDLDERAKKRLNYYISQSND